MITTLLMLIILLMTPFTAIGYVFIHFTLVKGMKAPADTSNRIAHLRLVWFALRTPEKFVHWFPWLAVDEGDLVAESENGH